MDRRSTFKNYEQLFSIFSSIQQQQQPASLLIDEDGLTRAEGKITHIEQSDDVAESTITIDNKQQITLKQVIAVNGLFRDDYSEC